MNGRVKIGLLICNFMFVALLCFYCVLPGIPTRIVRKFTATRTGRVVDILPPPWHHDDDKLEVLREPPAHKEKHWEDPLPQKLPQPVIDRIKTLVFFLGHPCSGHSIVGSLMDSHPHMVISHEFNLFKKLSSGLLAPNKSDIFNGLWGEARKTKSRSLNHKGYTLLVNDLYEGEYVDYIDVIGDKRGGTTTEMFKDHPGNWSSVFHVLQSLNVTLKVMHVIRNPYDNIATLLFFVKTSAAHTYGKVKQSNKKYTFNPDYIARWVNMYFQYHQTIVDVKKKHNLDIVEVHGRDLVSDPKGTLLKLCNQLGVTCSNNYLEMCSKKIYKSESRTRNLVNWTDKQVEMIQRKIEKYSCLKGYDFDSL